MKLEFSANKFGPYADRLRDLLNSLDGSYLHCAKRLSDAGPLDPIWFEPSKRSVVEDNLKHPSVEPLLPALERASTVIEGFESPLGMELLATVEPAVVPFQQPDRFVEKTDGMPTPMSGRPGDLPPQLGSFTPRRRTWTAPAGGS